MTWVTLEPQFFNTVAPDNLPKSETISYIPVTDLIKPSNNFPNPNRPELRDFIYLLFFCENWTTEDKFSKWSTWIPTLAGITGMYNSNFWLVAFRWPVRHIITKNRGKTTSHCREISESIRKNSKACLEKSRYRFRMHFCFLFIWDPHNSLGSAEDAWRGHNMTKLSCWQETKSAGVFWSGMY